MPFSHRLPILAFAVLTLAGCAADAVTEDEVVPIYESPCAVFDAGATACGAQPDENGSYVAAWSSLSCMDVCAALDTYEPHAVIACGPIHPALPGDENSGFPVVTCTFDAAVYQ